MDLKITINEQEVRSVAEKAAAERARAIASSTVGEYFSSKRNYGSKDGVGTLLIQEKIDAYLLSKDVDTLISNAVERCLHQQIDALAKEVVRHNLGKIIFSESQNKLDLERVRSIFRDVLQNTSQPLIEGAGNDQQ